MGSEVSKDRGCLREQIGDELILEMGRDDDLNIKQPPTNVHKYRLVGLMQGLQRVARLQEQLTNTQIDFRQKRREAAFKRDLVWDSDARFMRELQKLIAEGSENLQRDFKKLEHLADACQAARDILGPMEQEGIEAEQRWEGQIWSLRQAENHVYQEFNAEFRIAESYPPAPPSIDSSQYESSEFGSQSSQDDLPSSQGNVTAAIVPTASLIPQTVDIEPPLAPLRLTTAEPALLGVETRETEANLLKTNSAKWDNDSGIEDIDRPSHTRTIEGLIGPPQRLPARKYASELYPNLHTDFGTKRDRINKWLESSALASRIEATSIFTVLRDKMIAESMQMPSNWAQLVIAYWELDGAVTPNHYPPLPDVPPIPDLDSHSSIEN
jgi:hypothetical protein